MVPAFGGGIETKKTRPGTPQAQVTLMAALSTEDLTLVDHAIRRAHLVLDAVPTERNDVFDSTHTARVGIRRACRRRRR